MNKIIILAVVVGAVFLGLIFTAQKNPPKVLSIPEVSIMPTAKTATADKETANARYQVYTKESFDLSKDKKRILYFHADWCPVCRPLDKELTQNQSDIPSDVVIFKTDYDTEEELIIKYAVTYQHTFVQVDADGKAVITWSGGNLTDILKKIQ